MFKVKIAKIMMNIMFRTPTFDISNPRSENIKHKYFLEANKSERRAMLFQMALAHYHKHENTPFANNFPGYSFSKIFEGKTVLDLGCWCGGMAVSFAESWGVKRMCGVDINSNFVDAAKHLSSSRNNNKTKYEFKMGYGEDIPYPENTFDSIITWEVFEHVSSLEQTLKECKRVLKPGGLLFTVFPSYYTPGESHLSFVTDNPLIHWFMDSNTLNIAYNEILESRGKDAYWYRGSDDGSWQKLKGGIGINGTTFQDFRKSIAKVGFSKYQIMPTPLFSVGKSSMKNYKLKYISRALRPFAKMRMFQDFFSHRIVSILVV